MTCEAFATIKWFGFDLASHVVTAFDRRRYQQFNLQFGQISRAQGETKTYTRPNSGEIQMECLSGGWWWVSFPRDIVGTLWGRIRYFTNLEKRCLVLFDYWFSRPVKLSLVSRQECRN